MWYARRDSNPRTWLRRPALYPTELRAHLPVNYSQPTLRNQGPQLDFLPVRGYTIEYVQPEEKRFRFSAKVRTEPFQAHPEGQVAQEVHAQYVDKAGPAPTLLRPPRRAGLLKVGDEPGAGSLELRIMN